MVTRMTELEGKCGHSAARFAMILLLRIEVVGLRAKQANSLAISKICLLMSTQKTTDMKRSHNLSELRKKAEKSLYEYIRKDEKRKAEWEIADYEWKENWKRGWIEGYIEGFEIGVKKASEEIAFRCLQLGISAEIIHKCTDLSMDEILSMKEKLR